MNFAQLQNLLHGSFLSNNAATQTDVGGALRGFRLPGMPAEDQRKRKFLGMTVPQHMTIPGHEDGKRRRKRRKRSPHKKYKSLQEKRAHDLVVANDQGRKRKFDHDE